MTDEERIELLASLEATEGELAAELRAVRKAVLLADAQRKETPISALRKGKGTARARV